MEANQASGTDLLRTIGACILAPIATLIGAALAGGLWFLLNFAFTVIRPEVLGFIAAIIGGVAGMYAARFACDSWLKGYIPQAVFFVYAIFLSIMLYLYLFVIPFEWNKLASYAQLIVIGFLSYRFFWVVDPIDS